MITFKEVRKLYPDAYVIGVSEALTPSGAYLGAEEILNLDPLKEFEIDNFEGETFIRGKGCQEIETATLIEYLYSKRINKVNLANRSYGRILFPDYKVSDLLSPLST